MIVFKTFLLIFSSLGYVVFYNRVWGQPVLVTPFLTICTVTLLLYVFGVAGFLLPGAIMALAIGLVMGRAFILGEMSAPYVRYRFVADT